jgi:hypothetical protein
MLAHHPTTGQPIRILRTEPTIYKDNRTLVWLRPEFKESHRWNRWNVVISEIDAIPIANRKIDAIVLPADADVVSWFPVLQTFCTSDSEVLLIAPTAIIDSLYADGFSYERCIPYEELYDTYPYLGEPITAKDPIEKVILSVAHVLRMNRIVWTAAAIRDELAIPVRMAYDAWNRTCNGTLMHVAPDADDAVVPRMWLIQQYFRHSNSRRAREIHTCLERNLACPYIDHVLLLNEQAYADMPVSEKLSVHHLPHRITYYDVLRTIQTQVPAGAYVAFANADIWFNETLADLWRIQLAERRLCLALLRWEDNGAESEPTIFGPRADSQDAWIVARDCVDFDVSDDEFGFPFGKPCCDNAIALLMLKKRFIVANPAYSIHAMHLHISKVRNYNPKDILYRPHYLHVDPTAIQPMRVVNDLVEHAAPKQIAAVWNKHVLGKSFARPVLSLRDDDAKLVCNMLKLDRIYKYVYSEQNMYTPDETIPLYNFKGGAFVTMDGLVSSFKDIYVGAHPVWKTMWESANLSSIMTSVHIPSMIAIPCDDLCAWSLGAWVLKYLPRVLAIRRAVASTGKDAPEFLVPRIPDVGSFLNDCKWSDGANSVSVTPMFDDMNYYSEDVWAVPPTDGFNYTTMQDIELLRELLPPHTSDQDCPVAVFCVDDDEHAVCTRGWAEETADKILPSGWKIIYSSASDLPSVRRKAFQEASWIFGMGAALDWIWYARPGTSVCEFMYDDAPVGDHIHLAGAAELRHVLSVVHRREATVWQRQNALMDVGRIIKQYGFKEMLAVTQSASRVRPRILLPAGEILQGIHAHDGSGFREMVRIWEERRYVTVESTSESSFCWWGGIGETLLYDRPTARWWHNPPNYQMAMFGSPAPPGPPAHSMRQSLWGYWGKSPRALESIAASLHNLRGYDSRPIASLFLGKVENGLQIERTRANWSSAVELFSMPVDITGAKYPYTMCEYLDKLCNARFGLCLPGSGTKCNRIIEYFACGCVPIVTDGVNTQDYLVQPIEGVHYFKASKPEDVARIVRETPPAKWAEMSAAGRNWWRNYASAEGFFRLTWARIEQCRPYLRVGIPKQFYV